MNVKYLIRLWKSSNLDTILIRNLPVARETDKVIVEPVTILTKDEKLYFGEKLTSYNYINEIFENCIFEFISSDDVLEVKVIYKYK